MRWPCFDFECHCEGVERTTRPCNSRYSVGPEAFSCKKGNGREYRIRIDKFSHDYCAYRGPDMFQRNIGATMARASGPATRTTPSRHALAEWRWQQ